MRSLWKKAIIILLAHALLFACWHWAPGSVRMLLYIFSGLSTFMLTSGMMPIYLYALVAIVPVVVDLLLFGILIVYSRNAKNVSRGRLGVFIASALVTCSILAVSLWSIYNSIGSSRGGDKEVNFEIALSLGVAAVLFVWLTREYAKGKSEKRPLRSEFLENYGFALYFYFFFFGVKMGFLA